MLDSHLVQRVPSGGWSRHEGGVGGLPPIPYGISYRSIIPKIGECENVFATFALSASHVAFSSCRMEPVFMITSQSAATAATLAIDDGVAVQALDYRRLAAQLRADSQVLSWDNSRVSTNGLILDQGEPGTSYSSGWASGANAGGWNTDYWHDANSGKGARWIRYAPSLPTNGVYDVYAWWVAHENRAANVPYDIAHPAGTTRVLVDQRVARGGWFKLLTTNFAAGAGASVTIRNEGTTGYVIADAIRFQLSGSGLPVRKPVIEVVAGDGEAAEFPTNTARFSFVRMAGDTNAAVTIQYSLAGSAQNGIDYALLSGTVVLRAGAVSTNLVLTPLKDELTEGTEEIQIRLQPSSQYESGGLTNAIIRLRDRGIDAWKKAKFSDAELGDSGISGDLADPDEDGLTNLLEYLFGGEPRLAAPSERPVASLESARLHLRFSRAKAVDDVALSFWRSPVPGAPWTPAEPDLEVMEVSDAGPLTRVHLRWKSEVTDAPLFLALRADRL
jgi:hypothetical protein